MLIRTLRPSDREDVQIMLVECGAFSENEVRAALEIFDSAEYQLLGAEIDGRLAGYVCLDQIALTQSTWYLFWLCVHPALQRRGIGAALVMHAVDFARSRGGERLVLETSGRPDYEGARRFYEKAGFQVVGRIADYYKASDDCLFYCKLIV